MSLDFEAITESKVEWPKRGRKPKPLPNALIKALQDAYTAGKVANLVMPEDQEKMFGYMLTKAGKQLNMRIERHIVRDSPQVGLITYHFKPRAKRNGETE